MAEMGTSMSGNAREGLPRESTGASVRVAVHSVTWNTPRGEDFAPWLDEVVSAGYDGVAAFAWQLADYFQRPDDLRTMLDARRLPIVGVTARLAETDEATDELMSFMARFGIPYLSYVDLDDRVPLADIAAALNERGRRAQRYGLKVRYHNRAGGAAPTQSRLEDLLELLDPDCARLMLDIGHATRDFTGDDRAMRAAGFLERHLHEIDYLEFKDYNEVTDLNTPLGEGETDFPAIFDLLARHSYSGWITVEQNGGMGRSLGRTPLECAIISRDYLRANEL